jgi:2,5-furandicarboxylate decarboxylase 1
MGLDATAPVNAPELAFKRIRVKGEEEVDLATALQAEPGAAVARFLSETRA